MLCWIRYHISVLHEKLKILSMSKAKEILSNQLIEMIESESTTLKVNLVISKPKQAISLSSYV